MTNFQKQANHSIKALFEIKKTEQLEKIYRMIDDPDAEEHKMTAKERADFIVL